MAGVAGLGYALIEARDLEAWQEFACGLLGLQVVTQTEDRLVLRLDEKAYRLDIRRGDADAVTVLGWQVKGPAELDELAQQLESNGYAVKRADADLVQERMVMGLVQFTDPDGMRLELLPGGPRRALMPTSSPRWRPACRGCSGGGAHQPG